MTKRGQLTIFIIIAVVIVIMLIVFFMLRSPAESQPIAGSEIVRDALVDCTEFMSTRALSFVSYQGGYNTPPERMFNFSPTFFPYYYYEGAVYLPTLRDYEQEMGAFVATHLPRCFDSISDAGFVVSYDTLDVAVSITEGGVEFVVDSYVTLSRDGQTMRVDLSEYPQFYDTKLFYLYEAAAFFVRDQQEDPEYYCISCITQMAEANDFKFYIFPLFDDVYFVMVFEDTDEPLILNFMMKYSPSVA